MTQLVLCASIHLIQVSQPRNRNRTSNNKWSNNIRDNGSNNTGASILDDKWIYAKLPFAAQT